MPRKTSDIFGAGRATRAALISWYDRRAMSELATQHWLVRVVQEAGLAVGETAKLHPQTPSDEVWNAVVQASGAPDSVLAQHAARHFRIGVANPALAEDAAIKLLPERLGALIQRSKALQSAVRRLDATIHAAPAGVDRGNPVERQLGLLKAAFEQE